MRAPEVDPIAPLPTAAPPRKSFAFHRNATFMSLLVGYMGYYLCRQNFAAAFGPMQEDLGLDEVTFGAMASFGTAFYAIGKFVSGPTADLFGGRRIFLTGLYASAVASMFFGLASGLGLFFALWAFNRLFQSLGWAGLVNVMPRWYPRHRYGTAMGAISISYQFGGVVATLLAGVLLQLGFGWRGLFLVPGVLLIGIGLVVGVFLKQSPEDVGHTLRDTAIDETTDHEHERPDIKRLLTTPRFLVVCGLSFALTLLREVFGLWMPAYFSTMGATAHVAAFKSMVFPLLGCAGTLFAGWYSDRYLRGRRGPIIIVFLLGLLAVLMGLLQVQLIARVSGVSVESWALVFIGLAGFFIFGPYSMVGGGVVALDFGGRRTAATAAGLLDGVGYIGATLAGIGVAKVVSDGGWDHAFAWLAAFTVVSVVLSLSLWRAAPESKPAT